MQQSLAMYERRPGVAYVAAGGLLDRVENDCVCCQQPSLLCTQGRRIRSRWMSIMDAMLAG